jgi:hypothetical protein
VFFQDVDNALGSVTIPKRDLARRPTIETVKSRIGSGNDLLRVSADDYVRTQTNRHRPFGVFSQRETWNAERGSFLLDSTRIGQYETSHAVEIKKVEVPKRIYKSEISNGFDPFT